VRRALHAIPPALLILLVTLSCGDGTGVGTQPTPTPTAAPITCGTSTVVPGTPALTTVRVAAGLTSPIGLASNGVDCRLFVVEQGGTVRIIRDGVISPTPFLDVSSEISAGGERGLLGLAFHPKYAENGKLYVNYTDKNGDTHIAEFRANPPTADTVDITTERLLLFVAQPFPNHNGGSLAFGPQDGYLYAGLGDGGSGGDPFGNGQKLDTYLGKILRIDVDGGTPYKVPPTNPFVGNTAAKPEIWAYGLRNPWRINFDSLTGDLLIADVGQNNIEEVDLGLASHKGGENYGWNLMEGTNCYSAPPGCSTAGLTLPITEYTHAEGCAIIGGVVYRGRRLPGYQGTYFYSDLCKPFVRSFRVANGQAVNDVDFTSSLSKGLNTPTSYGVDSSGEAYIVDYDGEIYQIVPAS
jgi:glucose/arabinose dehydrogenase